MDKVIKEFKEDEYTYKLGYDLYDNKVYPRIEIYKNEELLSGGVWDSGTCAGLFYFNAGNSSSHSRNYISTIKEMFAKLRQYNEIPQNIEDEFENIFLLYKLNDFKEN